MTADNGTILKLFKGIYIDYLPARNFDNIENDQQIWITKERLLKHGIVFDPNIYRAFSNKSDKLFSLAEKAIDLYGANAEKLNSTFYKRFSDVENSSEWRLRFDQLIHYLTTYGRGIVGQDGTSGSYEPEYLNLLTCHKYIQHIYREMTLTRLKALGAIGAGRDARNGKMTSGTQWMTIAICKEKELN